MESAAVTPEIPFQLVDAFTAAPFNGNQAGVVLDATGLSARQMQRIAREVNASETAFIFPRDDGPSPLIRWFTPGCEVGFCGHATLAAAHALAERAWAAGQHSPEDLPMRPRSGVELSFASAAGCLELRSDIVPDQPDVPLWWLKMPPPALSPANLARLKTCELLGLTTDDLWPGQPMTRTRDDDVIVLIRSWQRLIELRPNPTGLAEWSRRNGNIRGWCVATPDTQNAAIHVASRFFAPAAGVAEDPVTGSVHGPLAAMLVRADMVAVNDGRALLRCHQAIPGDRGGLVFALVETDGAEPRVTIGGQCQTTLRGSLRTPAGE
jgi:trans-2,3-dihydro-3-hydroxyanthranilate isomerase